MYDTEPGSPITEKTVVVSQEKYERLLREGFKLQHQENIHADYVTGLIKSHQKGTLYQEIRELRDGSEELRGTIRSMRSENTALEVSIIGYKNLISGHKILSYIGGASLLFSPLLIAGLMAL